MTPLRMYPGVNAKGEMESENRMGAKETKLQIKTRPVVTSDAEAEAWLPHFALASEWYHRRRMEGKSPEEALQQTLAEWRKLWHEAAYVPHKCI